MRKIAPVGTYGLAAAGAAAGALAGAAAGASAEGAPASGSSGWSPRMSFACMYAAREANTHNPADLKERHKRIEQR